MESLRNKLHLVQELWPGHGFCKGQMNQKLKERELPVLFTTHTISSFDVSLASSIWIRRYCLDNSFCQRQVAQNFKQPELSSLLATHSLEKLNYPVKYHEYIPESSGVMTQKYLPLQKC